MLCSFVTFIVGVFLAMFLTADPPTGLQVLFGVVLFTFLVVVMTLLFFYHPPSYRSRSVPPYAERPVPGDSGNN